MHIVGLWQQSEEQMPIMLATCYTSRIIILMNNKRAKNRQDTQTNKQTVTQRKRTRKQQGLLEEHSNGFSIAH